MVNNRLLARYTLRETMGLIVMGVAMFWSAGRIDWWQAWVVLIVTLGWVLATAIAILRTNPDLLAERLGPRKGAKGWDTAIIGSLGLLQLARYIIAGLDQRYGWTGGFPLAVQIVAIGVCILGYALFVWAVASNSFFSQIVRIQSERGHSVAEGGPYRYVRHPSYLGAILVELSVPCLLDSWWALLIGIISSGLLVLRTALEDRTLQSELSGYIDFARRVRWRLLPAIW